jgi:hypothetical protein
MKQFLERFHSFFMSYVGHCDEQIFTACQMSTKSLSVSSGFAGVPLPPGGPGEECSSDDDCSYEHGKCRRKKCGCATGYEVDGDGCITEGKANKCAQICCGKVEDYTEMRVDVTKRPT